MQGQHGQRTLYIKLYCLFAISSSLHFQAYKKVEVMVTRGYRIIKFRGRYWIFWNNINSYPSGMGESLVNRIPSEPEEHGKWLQAQRNFFAKWDSIFQDEMLTVTAEAIANTADAEEDCPWHAAFDERLVRSPTYKQGFGDLYIE